jgi:hypothetical protein
MLISQFVMILGGVLMLVACIRYIIVAARVRLAWAFAIPIIPFAGLVFAIKYWQLAKGPIRMYIASISLMILGMAIAPAEPPKVARCQHEDCQLTIPADWSIRNSLAEGTELQADKDGDVYVGVTSVDRQHLRDTTLETFAPLFVQNFSKEAQVETVTGPKQVQLADHPALQYTIEWRSEGGDITSIYTLVAGEQRFYIVHGGASTSDFPKHEQTLHSVIDSFSL